MGTSDTSYASPYSISALDTIPLPVLQLLISSGPLFGWIRQATQIIQWQSPRQSILALLLWNILCLWTFPTLLLGPPSLIMYKLSKDWLAIRTTRTRRDRLERARLFQLEKQSQQHNDDDHQDDERLVSQRQQQQREAEQEELISRKIQPDGQLSLDDTLEDVRALVLFVHRVKATWQWMMKPLDGTRLAIASALVYLVPIWWGLVAWLGTSGTLAWAGSLGLVAYSPWAPVIVMAICRQPLLCYLATVAWSYAVALLSSCQILAVQSSSTPAWKRWLMFMRIQGKKEKQKRMEPDQEDDKVARNEMVFQFEIYENQRWWLGANWTTNMLSTERGPWTDNRLVAIGSKDEFELPQDKDQKTWSWADNDWWVDMTGELDSKVDHSGWEYGNNAWQHMTGRPAIQTFTRRRRWCRRALLIEHRPVTNQQPNLGLRKRS